MEEEAYWSSVGWLMFVGPFVGPLPTTIQYNYTMYIRHNGSRINSP